MAELKKRQFSGSYKSKNGIWTIGLHVHGERADKLADGCRNLSATNECSMTELVMYLIECAIEDIKPELKRPE